MGLHAANLARRKVRQQNDFLAHHFFRRIELRNTGNNDALRIAHFECGHKQLIGFRHLFALGHLRDNQLNLLKILKLDQITLGDPQITTDMAQHAAHLAGIDAAIEALPDGYNTVCTEGMFSQGEWQLLSIARAAAADPAVLLLDEITANLDAETEARVLEALRRASAGRTVLSVSHRIYENLGGHTIEIKTQA